VTFAGLAVLAGAATILFLHDDLVGRITIPADALPWEEHLPSKENLPWKENRP
jgi:hypothetical protein